MTGARGQLGRELQVAFASQTVLATDEPDLDVTDAAAVGRTVDAFRPELIIHAAAYTDTRGCEDDPGLAMRVNGDGTRNVTLACRRAGAALLYVSTNEVFDGAKGEPYLETDEPRAINAYGSSKLLGERHVRSLLQKAYIVRTSWLYGGGNDFPAKVLQAKSGQLPMVTDEVSSPTWARDLAQAIARLVELDAPAGIYHLTNSGGLLTVRVGGAGAGPGRPPRRRAGADHPGPVRRTLSQAGLLGAGEHGRRRPGRRLAAVAGGAGGLLRGSRRVGGRRPPEAELP